jgi:hypothetical protein
MAKKKNKNQSSLEKDKCYKILNDSSDERPGPYMECYDIVYKDYDDILGTIKLRDEDLSSTEKFEKYSETVPKDFRPECYLDLINKFKNAKDKRKLRFDDFELSLLEKALDKGYSSIGTEVDLSRLRQKLAWANTVSRDISNRTNEQLQAFGRMLGFTNSRKTLAVTPESYIPSPAIGKQSKLDSDEIIARYEELVNSGADKKEAVKQCSNDFPFACPDACARFLRKQRRKYPHKHLLKNIPGFR